VVQERGEPRPPFRSLTSKSRRASRGSRRQCGTNYRAANPPPRLSGLGESLREDRYDGAGGSGAPNPPLRSEASICLDLVGLPWITLDFPDGATRQLSWKRRRAPTAESRNCGLLAAGKERGEYGSRSVNRQFPTTLDLVGFGWICLDLHGSALTPNPRLRPPRYSALLISLCLFFGHTAPLGRQNSSKEDRNSAA